MVRHLLLLILVAATSAYAAEPLFPNSGFESGTLQNWTADGEAFATQPTKGDNPAARGRESSWHDGEYWIGGFEACTGRVGSPGDTHGDQFTGTLTSTPFVVKQPYISFLVGGGRQPGQLGVKLKCGSEEMQLASGCDSESLIRCNADVREFLGKRAQLIVFDNATGPWGHINVDAFEAAAEPLPDTAQDFAISKSVTSQSYDDIDYSEPLRPQFHFSSGRNWINDPNGMVYDGEKYHLFFQHNPNAPQWGNMTWGHAVSPDMVHWKQVKHALMPYRVDGQSGTIFSGTAVVDRNNSLGVQKGDIPTLCAFFTFATQPKFYQAMAYSTDRGETWTYWNEGRPVVENQGFDAGERDPKVFWHEASQRWVMVLWVQQNPGRVRFLTSQNLTDWTFASDLVRDWAFECMDLAFILLDGDSARTKAVLYDASFDYEVGTFDGQEFHTEAGPFRAGGGNFYAAQTFNNQPQQRTIQIGWMRGGPNPAEEYGLPYNGQMSFPCELMLRTTDSGTRLFVWPIREFESLQRAIHTRTDAALGAGDKLLAELGPLDLIDIEIDFSPGSAKRIECKLSGASITYDRENERLQYSGVRDYGEPEIVTAFDQLAPRNGSVKLRMLIDRQSVEFYAFGGERFYVGFYSPRHDAGNQSIEALEGNAVVNRLVVRELDSAWSEK